VEMKCPGIISVRTWIALAAPIIVFTPGRVLAQILPGNLDPAIPRISSTTSSVPAYLLSGLMLALVVIAAFRSAHRGSRRGGRDGT
jgi:hypothetical protein